MDGETRTSPEPGPYRYGETQPSPAGGGAGSIDLGILIGVLVGEGHFGGDGRQPQVTLRMHTRHERLFLWLTEAFPGGRLYGPYHHGGRSYYQWMARGAYLRDVLVPLLEPHLERVDGHAAGRFREMCADYRIPLGGRLMSGTGTADGGSI
jgi:hypothetical protein